MLKNLMKGRVVALLVCWLLSPRVSSHAQDPQWERVDGPYGGFFGLTSARDQGVMVSTPYPSAFLWWPSDFDGPLTIPRLHFFSITGVALDGDGGLVAATYGDCGTNACYGSGLVRLDPDSLRWGRVFHPGYTQTTTATSLVALSADTMFATVEDSDYGANPVMLRTVDGGNEWHLIGGEMPGSHRLFTGKHLVFAASRAGVFRSADGGETWTKTLDGGSGIYWIEQMNDGAVYAAAAGAGLYVSHDGGLTWNVAISAAGRTGEWSIAESGGVTIVSARFYQDSGRPFLFQRSTDRGVTWEGVSIATLRIRSVAGRHDGSLYAGTMTDGIFRSTDGGLSWSKQYGIGAIDIRQIKVLENGRMFATSRSVGLLESSDGLTWRQVRVGREEISGFSGAIKGRLFATTRSGNISVSTDDGLTWRPTMREVFDVAGQLRGVYATSLAIDPNRRRVYVGTGNGLLLESDDLGSSWRLAANVPDIFLRQGAHLVGLVVLDNGDVFAARYHGGGVIYRYSNGSLSPVPELAGIQLSSVVKSASSLFFALSLPGHLYRSENGIEWEQVSSDEGTQNLAVGRDGSLFASAWAGLGSEIRKWDDESRSWLTLFAAEGENSSIASMAVAADGTLFVSLGDYRSRILRSEDDGKTWLDWSAGLPEDAVTMLAVTPGGHLLASTKENGLFRMQHPTTTSNETPEVRLDALRSSVHPNPFSGGATLSMYLPTATDVELSMYDVLGRRVYHEVHHNLASGENRMELDLSHLPAGFIFYDLHAGDERSRGSVIHVK